MKKVGISLLLFFITLPFAGSAQTTDYGDVKLFEFEIGLGGNIGLNYFGGAPRGGVQIFLEPRFNIKDPSIDIGIQGVLWSFARGVNYGNYSSQTIGGAILPFVDYNFRLWRSITPFAGLGFGVATVSQFYRYQDDRRDDSMHGQSSIVFNPRIGVEFFNHLRVTAGYKLLSSKEYSFFDLTIGYAFGGGPKRRK